jgi:GDP-4-dehydro-6-deoxy-D-mannose reductase
LTTQSIAITGVDGFVGKHLARQAKAKGLIVKGISKSLTVSPELESVLDEFYSADLTKFFPKEALATSVIHLAGLASVGPSFAAPQRYIEANSAMVTNLSETILNCSSKSSTKLVVVSTGALYQAPTLGQKLVEEDPIAFSSPYVVSKVLVENQVEYYKTRGINAVVARPFNHIGPGQQPGFLVPDLWSRLENLEEGNPLYVGNLNSARDYLDVRDVASAYIQIATSDTFSDSLFNICSGHATTGREILELLCREMNIPVPTVVEDSNLMRPNDALVITGSAARLTTKLGWKPKYSLQESLRDFVTQAKTSPA